MKKLLALLFLLPSLCFAQGASHQNIAEVINVANNQLFAIPGAVITVCPGGSTGNPCTPSSVPLFSNSTLTASMTNPFNADSSGNYLFWALPNIYTVCVSGIGVNGYCYQVNIALGGSVYNTKVTSNPTGATTNGIAAITMVVSVPATVSGSYMFNVYVSQITPTTGCGTQPTYTVGINWTDSENSAATGGFTSTPNGSGGLQTATPFTNVSGSVWSFYPLFFRAKVGTAITFGTSVTVGAGCATGAGYTVIPNLTQL